MKKNFKGCRFTCDEDVIMAVGAWLGSKDAQFYKSGITALEDRFKRCIELNGDYIE
jgi:hypothetical protein